MLFMCLIRLLYYQIDTIYSISCVTNGEHIAIAYYAYINYTLHLY